MVIRLGQMAGVGLGYSRNAEERKGVRSGQTIRYVPWCNALSHRSSLSTGCQCHSPVILDFVYSELKRLGRNSNQSRLSLVRKSALVVNSRFDGVLAAKAFRCIRGDRVKRWGTKLEAMVRTHKRRVAVEEDMREEMTLAEYL